MLRLNYSIRTLLVAIAIVAAYFPMRDVYATWRRARLQTTHQIFSDYETLAMIHEGDSVQDVTRYYPMLSSVPSNTAPWTTVANGLQSAGQSVQPSDEFYRYTLREEGMYGYLQFRDAKLVNHPDAVFSDPIANAARNGAALPAIFDRIGFFPIYLVMAAVAGVFCSIAVRLNGRIRRTARSDCPDIASNSAT